MKAAMYIRVGNKEQLVPETDRKKKEQEFKNFCERKKEQKIGEYIIQKERKKAICFVTAQPGDTVEIRNQEAQIEAYCREHGLFLSCVYEPSSREVRDRKAFFQVIAKAHSGQNVVLIVPSVSGISTQYKEFHDIIEILEENGIRVVSLNPAESMIFEEDIPPRRVEDRQYKGLDRDVHARQIEVQGRHVK